MSSRVVLGVRVNRNQYERIKIENVDLDGKVEILRESASQKINRDKKELELIYAGVIMEDESTLASYGVKQGVTVHVLEKKTPKTHQPKSIKEPEVVQLIAAIDDYRYKNMLQRLARPEVLTKIISSTPSLTQDPAAIALLQDPELVILFADSATLKRALEVHPVLIDALTNIVAYMKENATAMTQNVAGTSTGYSYSLDALSDDDDDMDSNGSSRESNPLARNSSYNAITAAQLAAAIANATTNFSSTGAVINPATQNAAGSLITNEMFGNALQQAFASSPGVTSTPPAFPVRNGEETFEAIRTRLQPQLQQMREMGLANEGVNIRALQATSGDVQAAVELVFNGVID